MNNKSPFLTEDKDFNIAEIKRVAENFCSNNAALSESKLFSVNLLLKTGIYLGKPRKMWNPIMRKYAVVDKDSKKLVEKKTNILLDIRKIIGSIFNAYQTINSIIKAGGYVLFVHTRNNYFKTASELNDITKNYLKEEATRVKSPYINQRWLGGTLTNTNTVGKSIDKLNSIIAMEKNGELAEKYTKKERLDLLNEMKKLEKFIGGIKEMPKNKKPSLMVVFDANYEKNAVLEAKKTGIPVIGVANTDCLNSHLLTNTVIANTTSIKATCFLISLFADAVASAMGQATKIVGKEDKDIILPYVKKDDSSSANIFGNRK